MPYISLEPVIISRLLKCQPRLFEGHVTPLLDRYLGSDILSAPDFETKAGRILRKKFDNAARGILLRISSDLVLRKIAPEDCHYRPKIEERWDSEFKAVVKVRTLSAEDVAQMRLDIVKAAEFLCDGTDRYRQLLTAHCAYLAERRKMTHISDEVLESKILSRALEQVIQELKEAPTPVIYDFYPGF